MHLIEQTTTGPVVTSPQTTTARVVVSHQTTTAVVVVSRSRPLSSPNHPHPKGDPNPVKYLETLAWVDCQAIGCHAGRAIDSRQLDNLNASGGWHCPEHEHEVTC